MNRFKITTLAVGIALATSAQATSFFEIEAGIGGTLYRGGGDGWYVQDAFGPHEKLTAPAFEAGFTGDLYQSSHWGVSWHADWAWLGTIHTQSLATPSDANYNVQTKSCNGPCWPLANYMGSGHDSGVFVTIEPHFDYAGWRFGIEGGPYLHRATWTEDVTGWVNSPTATDTHNFHMVHAADWQLGYVAGASVAYKNFTLAYQYFANGWASDDKAPQFFKGTHMLLVKYTADIF